MAAIQVGFASNTRTLQEIVSHVSQRKGESGQSYIWVKDQDGGKLENCHFLYLKGGAAMEWQEQNLIHFQVSLF